MPPDPEKIANITFEEVARLSEKQFRLWVYLKLNHISSRQNLILGMLGAVLAALLGVKLL